jgi:hypothetical protein
MIVIVVSGALEVLDALAKGVADLRQLSGAEDEQDDKQDDYQLNWAKSQLQHVYSLREGGRRCTEATTSPPLPLWQVVRRRQV